jgi:hypothetical protein
MVFEAHGFLVTFRRGYEQMIGGKTRPITVITKITTATMMILMIDFKARKARLSARAHTLAQKRCVQKLGIRFTTLESMPKGF